MHEGQSLPFLLLLRDLQTSCFIHTDAIISVVTVLVRGSLEGPSSNLGSRYIIVLLAVSLSTSGNKVELAPLSRGVQFKELTRVGHIPRGFSPCRGPARHCRG
jgi:hypothetical protein